MKHKSFVLIFIFILCVCVFIILGLNQEKNTAYIYLDNTLIEKIDLNAVNTPYTIPLAHNTILVEKNNISVTDADCPDKICVKTGKISDTALSIVCIPNKLIIEIKK